MPWTRPDRFVFGPDRHSSPVSELTGEEEAVRDAAIWCPVHAISLTDAETGAPFPLD
jgi:ferredoxin